MKTYGQFCPVAKAAELFCERWTALIIRDLACGATRFSELQRGVPLMSPSLLSKRLRQLEAEGILERRGAKGRGATYHLTEAGGEFAPIVEALGIWGQRWTRRELAEHEIDLGLLIWGLETRVDPTAFGLDRGLVRLEFTDQPSHKRFWWFVCEDGKTTLCVEDPGFEVTLYVTATLADMIRVYRGDISIAAAVESDRLEAIGSTAARRRLSAWLNLSPLSAVQTRRRQIA